MKKTLRISIGIAMALVLCFSIISFASSDIGSDKINRSGVEIMLKVAGAIKDYKNTDVNQIQTVIGEVNGEKIYNKNFELDYIKAVEFGSDDPYGDAIKSTEERILDLQYAQENDISVTDTEVQEYVAYQRDLYENESDSEVKAVLTEYISALGMTEDEYWNDFEVEESYNYLLHCKVLKSQKENNVDRDVLLKDASIKITDENYKKDKIDKNNFVH